MDSHAKLRQLISIKGPAVPSNVNTELGLNLLLTSVLMAELVSKNVLKVSSVKIGGSPLYYLPGQEARLQDFSKYLHEKERKAYDLLKEKRLLRDTEVEPVVRVALRGIKDFAVPLKVGYEGKSEIFWKWYLVSNEEAGRIIKDHVGVKEPVKEAEPVKKIDKPLPAEIKEAALRKEPEKEPNQKEPQPRAKQATEPKGNFLELLTRYFKISKITLISKETNKRKTEINAIIDVPSAIGDLRYFCMAKNKKKIDDSDLASAFVQGQQNKLPVLYLTTGELTKKAKEMLGKEFKGVHVKRI